MTRRRPHLGPGFGSIEAMIAIALLSMTAAAVSSTLVLARRVQTHTAAERRAMHLAVSALERLRAGETPAAFDDPPGFVTEASLTSHAELSALVEARVEVRWHAERPRTLELKTLLVR